MDEKTQEAADDGEAQKCAAHQDRRILPGGIEEGAETGADDDGDKGRQFEQPVGSGDAGFVNHFRQKAVLGGTEEVGLRCQQEEYDEQVFDATADECADADQHGHDLEALGYLKNL